MTKYIVLCILFGVFLALPSFAQEASLQGWQVQLSFGELPWQSFKPGLSVGYRFNRHIYLGALYQMRNTIRRGSTSFNANAAGLEGLQDSHERMGQRAALQVRLYPLGGAAYVSGGVVFNDADAEHTTFDARPRSFGEATYHGSLVMHQKRAAGWRPALGIGYNHSFDGGWTVGTEMFVGISAVPRPTVQFDVPSDLDTSVLEQRIAHRFRRTPTNLYHVFHLGVGYRFP